VQPIAGSRDTAGNLEIWRRQPSFIELPRVKGECASRRMPNIEDWVSERGGDSNPVPPSRPLLLRKEVDADLRDAQQGRQHCGAANPGRVAPSICAGLSFRQSQPSRTRRSQPYTESCRRASPSELQSPGVLDRDLFHPERWCLTLSAPSARHC
jgi:hypothetical protein